MLKRANMRTENIASLAELRRLAAQTAKSLKKPQLVLLDGPLGSGKTQMVRFMGEFLGVPEGEICSPGFGLINIYSCPRGPVAHADLFRLGEEQTQGQPSQQALTGRSSQQPQLLERQPGRPNKQAGAPDPKKLKLKGGELESTGFWDLFCEPGFVFIEWARLLNDENLPPLWNKLRLAFSFESRPGGQGRRIFISAGSCA